MQIKNTLPDPSATLHGHASFELLENGAFLIMRSGVSGGPPDSVSVIGRDESIKTYSMLYFDSRGVSRIYEMSLNDDTWKLWRKSPGFSQRFIGTFGDNGSTLAGKWERSRTIRIGSTILI